MQEIVDSEFEIGETIWWIRYFKLEISCQNDKKLAHGLNLVYTNLVDQLLVLDFKVGKSWSRYRYGKKYNFLQA